MVRRVGVHWRNFVCQCLYLALSSIFRLGSRKYRILDPELAHLHPHFAAMLSAYTAGMFSIAVGYLLPTFMVLGLATVFISLVRTTPPFFKHALNVRLVLLMILLSLAVVICIYGYVRLFVNWA